MYYKLGSQLDCWSEALEGQEKYEWNICLLDIRRVDVIQNLSIGFRTAHDPIVRLARNLVNELNKENTT